MRKTGRFFRNFILLICGFAICILALSAAKPSAAEAAPAENVFTEPFLAPYYPTTDAVEKQAAASYAIGWQKDGDKWFYMISERTYYANGWKQIGEKWYYFDENGYCVTGWIRMTEEVRWGPDSLVTYLDPQNAWMVTGYQKISGVGRYFNSSGFLLSGRGNTAAVSGETYILDDAGICSRVVQSQGNGFQNASDVFESLGPDDVLSGNYEFQAKVNENTVIEPFGFDEMNGIPEKYDYLYWCSVRDQNLRGKIGAWYRNVGTFEGREVDVKFTITDYRLLTLYGEEWGMIGFNKDAIGIAQTGVEYSECRIEFYDHDRKEKIHVRGYATVADIDAAQACAVTSPYDRIYVADNCELLYTEGNGNVPIFADDINHVKMRDDEDSSGQILVYYDSDYFSYRFYQDCAFWKNDLGLPCYSGTGAGTCPHFTEEDEKNDPDLGMHSWQGYVASRFARVETPYPPSKTVSDENEKDVEENTLGSLSETFTYKISQNVPLQSQEKFYYSDYKIIDELEPCLTFMGAKVTDDAGKDVSGLYNIRFAGQTVTFSLKDPGNPGFYGKNYHYLIDVRISSSSDLSGYSKGNMYVVPNKARLIVKSAYEDTYYDTNEVKTKISTLVKDCSIKITKTGSRDQAPLKDAGFTLYVWNGRTYEEFGELENNGDGTYVISGLAATVENGGWYKVVETRIPDGFEGGWEQQFQISDSEKNGKVFEWNVENDPVSPKGTVVVFKKDKVTGTGLPGAVFGIYEWNKNTDSYETEPVQILSSSEDTPGKYVSSVLLERTEKNDGWYRIRETENPENYTGTWEQEFRIQENGDGMQKFEFTVENIKLLTLQINKKVVIDDLWEEHGDAVFLYEISGKDVNGSYHNYAESVTITEQYAKRHASSDGTVTVSVQITDIPSGNYEIKECKTARYALADVTAETHNVTVALTETGKEYGGIRPVRAEVTADLTEKDAEITFFNRKISWDRFSHNDLVINRFTAEK